MPRKLRLKGHDTLHLGPDGASAGMEVSVTGELGFTYREVPVTLVKADVDVPTGTLFQLRVPPSLAGHDLVGLRFAHSTAGAGTGNTQLQIERVRGGVSVDMLSTPLEIDSSELDSADAVTGAVIDTANDDLALMDQLRFVVDQIPGTTAPQGLDGYLVTRRPAV